MGRSAVGMKPICCGDRRDAELLLAAGSEGVTIDEINPIWLQTPLAPLAAAQVENFDFQLEVVLKAFAVLEQRAKNVLVEGVGGWLVPIQSNFFVSDLAAAFDLPVLVVAQNKLGCLNHTLLTLESIARRGLRCVGVVLNEFDGRNDIAQATNRNILEQVCGVPILAGLKEKDGFLTPEWRATLTATESSDCSPN